MERKRARGRGPLDADMGGGLVCSAVLLFLLISVSSVVEAQVFGTTLCVCSPSAYTMTLGFSQTCNTTSISDGVIMTDCAIAPFQDDNVTDLVPVTVGSIDILELYEENEELVLLTQSSKFGTFSDGESFEFTSISSDPSMVNATAFPKALQVSILGNNAAGDSLFFAGLIIFKTDCSTYPVLNVGDSIGWITFMALTDPVQSVCPIVETRPPSTTKAPIPPPPPTTNGMQPSVPSRSTRSPAQPSRSTRAPAPTKLKTKPPSCEPYSSSSSSSSKGKGKSSKGKSSKAGVRGKGKDKKSKHYYHHDIFDHGDCNLSKRGEGKSKKSSSKRSKGKGKGSYYYPYPPHPPTDPIPTAAPTGGKASIDDSSSVDRSSVDQPEQFVDGQRRFWGSSVYYSVLLILTASIVVGAVYAWKRPQKLNVDRGRLIALQKGLEWSERQ